MAFSDPEKAAVYMKGYHQRYWQLALDHYGRICACCGETEEAFLTIDHIGGNGAEHRREIGQVRGHNMARWLIKNGRPPGFQILCYNCNCSKQRLGACPHVSLASA